MTTSISSSQLPAQIMYNMNVFNRVQPVSGPSSFTVAIEFKAV